MGFAMICLTTATGVATQLAAISNDTRLRLLFRLATGPQHVTRLAELVGAAATNVCQHLQLMRQAGLIESERKKFRVMYRVRPEILTPGSEGVLATIALGPYRLELKTDCEISSIDMTSNKETHSREECGGATRNQFTVSDRPLSFGPRARRKRTTRVKATALSKS
jgi:ArsR family transcriptional regulator